LKNISLTVLEHIASDTSEIPAIIRAVLQRIVDEIRSIWERLRQIDVELRTVAGHSEVCQRLQKIPGVGLIAATAFAGSVGNINSFWRSWQVRIVARLDATGVLVRACSTFGQHQQARQRAFADAPGAGGASCPLLR
jgi:transposase